MSILLDWLRMLHGRWRGWRVHDRRSRCHLGAQRAVQQGYSLHFDGRHGAAGSPGDEPCTAEATGSYTLKAIALASTACIAYLDCFGRQAPALHCLAAIA